MHKLNADHIRNMFELLESGTPEVTINNFTFTEDSASAKNNVIKINYKGETFLRRHFEDITTEYILELLRIPSKYNKPSDSIPEKTSWTYVEQSKYIMEWTTNIDENKVYIGYNGQRPKNNYNVHAPVEDKSQWNSAYGGTTKDVAETGKPFEELDTAILYAINYLLTYTPDEIDKYVRMDKVAKEKFQEITGVGEKTVEELVEENHIRTYEGLKNNIRKLSRNYQNDAKKDINERIEQEEYISKHPTVKEISAKQVLKNI